MLVRTYTKARVSQYFKRNFWSLKKIEKNKNKIKTWY